MELKQYITALLAGWSDVADSKTRWDIQNATAFAYTYGYPLYAYALGVQGTPNATVNTLIHQRSLATADDTWVVWPNADTLYSRVFIDISTSDLSLDIPDFGHRYWIWSFYDVYGNNVANIGAIRSDPAGKYLVRYKPEHIGVEMSNVSAPYRAYINLSTPYGISLTRILVQESTDDVALVHSLQDQLSITEVSRLAAPAAPELDLSLFMHPNYVPGDRLSLEEAVLRLTAEFARFNHPTVAKDKAWVSSILKCAGLRNNHYERQPGINLTNASAAADASAAALLATPGFVQDLGKGWTTKNASIIGDYGSYYQARYQIALVGYLALTTDQAVYSSYKDEESICITAGQALLITFVAAPRTKSVGFWSLTAYNEGGYLIPNELNRHSLGDRSNLSLSNGSKLGDGYDGCFQILLQASNVVPPESWMTNWLPAPVNGGVVSIALRLFGAEASMTDGTYTYPTVEIIDAIKR